MIDLDIVQKLYFDAEKICEAEGLDEAWSFGCKFTEMIIKECGVALNPMLRDQISRGQAYDLIKEHFRVE